MISQPGGQAKVRLERCNQDKNPIVLTLIPFQAVKREGWGLAVLP